ncbi:MAG: hypothetical protein IKR57_04300 [Bacilli bacterium]|nr:hypothetical protein [Bacilli bacterium]
MLNLYRKVEKSIENKQGSIYLTECPFERPCLLCVSAQDIEKSVFGITKLGMKMARLRTRKDNGAMFDVKGFPVNFLAIRREIDFDQDTDRFVERYVSKILTGSREEVKRNLRNINIIAYCDGLVRVKKILKSIEKKLIENGFDNIEELMSQICIVTLSTLRNISDIKATVIDFHDINDTEADINKNNISEEEVERAKKEEEVLTIKPNNKVTYTFNGSGDHNLHQFFKDCKSLSAVISKIISNILRSSIEGSELTVEKACEGVSRLIDLKDKLSRRELMDIVDSELVYEGASKLSARECEMMDTMDELFISQYKMEMELRNLKDEKKQLLSRKDSMLETAKQSCSEATYYRILQSSGWQLGNDKIKIIEENPSDKEIIEQMKESIKVK